MMLFWQQFKAQRTGFLIWILAAVVLTMGSTAAAGAVADGAGLNQFLQTLPPKLQAMMGVVTGLSPIDAFVAVKVAPTVGLVIVLYGVLLGLSIITREVDRRTMDFLLALPIQRRQIIISRVAAMAVSTGAMTLLAWLTTWGDLSRQGLSVSGGSYGLIYLGYWLLAMALGGLTLLTSVRIDDYSFGVKLWLSVVSVAFMLEYALKAAALDRWQRFFSPFSYVDAVEILRHGALPAADTLVLAVLAIGSVALAIPLFDRKQIAA